MGIPSLDLRPGFHFFGILSELKGIDHFLNITIQKRFQGIQGHTDAVVGDPALRVVVGSDFGRPVSAAHQTQPFALIRLLPAVKFQFIEPVSQHLHGLS